MSLNFYKQNSNENLTHKGKGNSAKLSSTVYKFLKVCSNNNNISAIHQACSNQLRCYSFGWIFSHGKFKPNVIQLSFWISATEIFITVNVLVTVSGPRWYSVWYLENPTLVQYWRDLTTFKIWRFCYMYRNPPFNTPISFRKTER